jgi:hypothetical protein
MNDDTSRKWFTAKDIKKYLEITNSQLYHWSRVWGLVAPELKAEGRAHKDKYSFTNLLDLALIKQLNKFGFEPGQLKKFINPFPELSDAPEEWKGSIWNYYKDGRDDYDDIDDPKEGIYTVPGYDKDELFLLIFLHEGKYRSYRGTLDQVFSFIKDFNLKVEGKDDSVNLHMINLTKIIRELENETGERL